MGRAAARGSGVRWGAGLGTRGSTRAAPAHRIPRRPARRAPSAPSASSASFGGGDGGPRGGEYYYYSADDGLFDNRGAALLQQLGTSGRFLWRWTVTVLYDLLGAALPQRSLTREVRWSLARAAAGVLVLLLLRSVLSALIVVGGALALQEGQVPCLVGEPLDVGGVVAHGRCRARDSRMQRRSVCAK